MLRMYKGVKLNTLNQEHMTMGLQLIYGVGLGKEDEANCYNRAKKRTKGLEKAVAGAEGWEQRIRRKFILYKVHTYR